MEEAKTPGVVELPVWIVKLLAATATANVFIVIFFHWKGYDWLGKSLAVTLLANLIAIPAVATWGRVKRYPWQSLAPAYIFLTLATMLFGIR
jgi:hypothetical protein